MAGAFFVELGGKGAGTSNKDPDDLCLPHKECSHFLVLPICPEECPRLFPYLFSIIVDGLSTISAAQGSPDSELDSIPNELNMAIGERAEATAAVKASGRPGSKLDESAVRARSLVDHHIMIVDGMSQVAEHPCAAFQDRRALCPGDVQATACGHEPL